VSLGSNPRADAAAILVGEWQDLVGRVAADAGWHFFAVIL
jgi:hypothetical protein